MQGRRTERLVYIVDDESLLGEMAEAVLSGEGFRSKVFTDPIKALESMQTAESLPALLVTDCVMTGMSGLELIKHSRQTAPEIKTILLSGTVSAEYVEASGVRPDRFIPKPYNVQLLIGAVRELIGK